MSWRHVDLCSGIGGFALAARWAGMTTVGFCEIDPWCQQVLAHHWPGVPIHGDVKTLTGDVVRGWGGGVVDVLTAGYPCQPFSVAGNRMGKEDDRHLWPWIGGLVRDLRPRWCLFENVVGHVRLGLDDVLAELEKLGYAVWAAVVPAASVGAPHFRDRVWIVARRADVVDTDGEHRVSRVPDVGADGGQEQAIGGREPDRAGGAADVADADDAGREEQWRRCADGSEHAAAERGGAGGAGDAAVVGVGGEDDGVSGRMAGYPSLIPWWRTCVCEDLWCVSCETHVAECGCPEVEELLHFVSGWWGGDPRQAFGPWWEDGVPRVVAQEEGRTAKLRALGNAIVPQVAHEILLAMREAEVE